MIGSKRKLPLQRWLPVAALVACFHVLMGAYWWSCTTPVHGIFPWGCHLRGASSTSTAEPLTA